MARTLRNELTLERLLEVCERFYARDGFVKWTDVGKALGVSRQTVQIRLKTAVERGDLPPETVERFQSLSSRAATARERAEASYRKSHENRLRIQISPENFTWLMEECAFRKAKSADIIDGLISRERLRRANAEE